MMNTIVDTVRRPLFAGLLLLVSVSPVFSQSGFFSARSSMMGARAAALADADLAGPYDANTLYANPAALSGLQVFSLVANHMAEKRFNGMSQGVSIPFRTGYREVLAFGLTVNHIGYAVKSVKQGAKAIQFGYDVAYAKEIVPAVSLGASLGVRYGKTGTSGLWSVGSSVGVFYAPAEEITYGLVYSGVGTGIDYLFTGGTTVISSVNLPRSLQAGVSLRYPAIRNRNVVSLAVANEKIFGEAGIRYFGGIEIFPVQFFALRGGYRVESDLKAARYGCGIRLDNFHLDLSLSPSRSTDQSVYVTAGLVLWNPVNVGRN